MLPELYRFLLRCGTKKYAVVDDVEKAFRQVQLNEKGRDFTKSPQLMKLKEELNDKNLIIYYFKRAPLGSTSSISTSNDN